MTVVTDTTEPKLSLTQRLMADSPVFWKIISLLSGGLLIVTAALLKFDVLPQFKPVIVDLVGPVLSAAWGLSQFAAKTPITANTFTIEGAQLLFSQWMGAATQAKETFDKPFDPAMVPKASDVDATIVEVKTDLATSQNDLYNKALADYPASINPTP